VEHDEKPEFRSDSLDLVAWAKTENEAPLSDEEVIRVVAQNTPKSFPAAKPASESGSDVSSVSSLSSFSETGSNASDEDDNMSSASTARKPQPVPAGSGGVVDISQAVLGKQSSKGGIMGDERASLASSKSKSSVASKASSVVRSVRSALSRASSSASDKMQTAVTKTKGKFGFRKKAAIDTIHEHPDDAAGSASAVAPPKKRGFLGRLTKGKSPRKPIEPVVVPEPEPVPEPVVEPVVEEKVPEVVEDEKCPPIGEVVPLEIAERLKLYHKKVREFEKRVGTCTSELDSVSEKSRRLQDDLMRRFGGIQQFQRT